MIVLRQKTKKFIYAALAGAGVTLMVGSGGGVVFYQEMQEREITLKSEYKTKVEQLEKIATRSERAYALKQDVVQGTALTVDMLQEVYVPKSAAATDRFATLALLENLDTPYYARSNLTMGSILTHALVYEEEPVTKDMRNAEYAFIELPTKLVANDYVDVRIQFPSGDDFVLFSKKKVTDVRGLKVWFNVDEADILMMSSAMVDAYVQGARIYALPYVDKHLQVKSELTYPVKENVKDLIISSPNIVNIAKVNLEAQNRERMELYLKQVDEATREKINAGQSKADNEADQADQRLTEEERINEISNSQKNFVGGDQN